MGRRKKTTEKIVGSLGTKDFPFCGNRKCQQFDCVRHVNYIPWNTLVYRQDFVLDKDGNCKDKMI